MELYQYILIGVGVLLIALTLFLILKGKKKQLKNYDLQAILDLLDKTNIKSIDYMRNKIIINFVDVELFNVEALHEKGALGVNIIGDKIKFYFDGGNEHNEYVYNEIKKYIER